jgi:hypothetical protein
MRNFHGRRPACRTGSHVLAEEIPRHEATVGDGCLSISGHRSSRGRGASAFHGLVSVSQAGFGALITGSATKSSSCEDKGGRCTPRGGGSRQRGCQSETRVSFLCSSRHSIAPGFRFSHFSTFPFWTDTLATPTRTRKETGEMMYNVAVVGAFSRTLGSNQRRKSGIRSCVPPGIRSRPVFASRISRHFRSGQTLWQPLCRDPPRVSVVPERARKPER